MVDVGCCDTHQGGANFGERQEGRRGWNEDRARELVAAQRVQSGSGGCRECQVWPHAFPGLVSELAKMGKEGRATVVMPKHHLAL